MKKQDWFPENLGLYLMHLGQVPPLFPKCTRSFHMKARDEALLCFLFCDIFSMIKCFMYSFICSSK